MPSGNYRTIKSIRHTDLENPMLKKVPIFIISVSLFLIYGYLTIQNFFNPPKLLGIIQLRPEISIIYINFSIIKFDSYAAYYGILALVSFYCCASLLFDYFLSKRYKSNKQSNVMRILRVINIYCTAIIVLILVYFSVYVELKSGIRDYYKSKQITVVKEIDQLPKPSKTLNFVPSPIPILPDFADESIKNITKTTLSDLSLNDFLPTEKAELQPNIELRKQYSEMYSIFPKIDESYVRNKSSMKSYFPKDFEHILYYFQHIKNLRQNGECDEVTGVCRAVDNNVVLNLHFTKKTILSFDGEYDDNLTE